MDDFILAAEQISLFCRLNINSKKELPIRASEMGMLIYLCKTDGDKTPMGVANFFKVTKAMATNMVSSLSKKGYLEKQPAQEDRRSILLVPTPLAKQLVNSTYEEYYKTMKLLQDKMGAEQFSILTASLQKANQILLEEKENG
ncbi:MarR family winged helix-turn-helix transcriptional regulator [uncultured Robinsoniella sp.]|uniref:MarR family winged helix-turn-helix transcriptional regulator n=1 Tax=uncultured Robinsoniella sp. TaxID=904190 RepID=UPI00374EC5C9